MEIEKAIKKLSEEIKIRGYSRETLKAYKYNLKQFLMWINKQNKRITDENIRTYFLILEKKL